MKINKVTITGLDNKTDLQRVGELWRRFPFVEFGVLFSLNSSGVKNRYPTIEKIKWITHTAPREKLSLHLCGSICRDTLQGKNTIKKEFMQTPDFARIQFNNIPTDTNIVEANKLICSLGHEESIFPLNPKSQENSLAIAKVHDKSVGLLHDRSGGRGVTTLHQKPVSPFYNGYAGGLGPDNIETQMNNIAHIVGDATIWIDMETKVRTDDWLDLDKVEDVLRKVKDSGYLE